MGPVAVVKTKMSTRSVSEQCTKYFLGTVFSNCLHSILLVRRVCEPFTNWETEVLGLSALPRIICQMEFYSGSWT